MSRPRIAIVYVPSAHGDDAIGQYCDRLVDAITSGQRAEAVRLDMPSRPSLRAWGRLLAHGSGYDAYVLQYNPYSFGRWGIAPWLVLGWAILTRGAQRSAVNVHEAFDCHPNSLRQHLLSTLHRHQLSWLAKCSDMLITTSHTRSIQLTSRGISSAREIPIGSTAGDAVDPAAAGEVRHTLGLSGTHAVVVATFGKNHPVHSRRHIAAAIEAMRSARLDVCVLNLGSGAPVLEQGVREIRPGYLPAAALLAHLAASDLVLLPYSDGAATNRSTLMAALAMGRPVLTTHAATTDVVLLKGAIVALPVDDLDAFGQAAVRLAGDPRRRAELGTQARRLYDAEFAWGRIADATVDALLTP